MSVRYKTDREWALDEARWAVMFHDYLKAYEVLIQLCKDEIKEDKNE